MAKVFECDCTDGFVARGEDDDTLMREVERHVAEAHPELVGTLVREQILASSEVVVLAKPQHSDVAALSPGQVLWGWPHCVQDAELTQLAIDRRLTLIAFEAMNHWTADGRFSLHVFHKNNELAGYCSVLQALELIGSTGDYGRRLDE